ncbi:MAG: PAS domain-containing protein [Gammaproteobacteria bacterium]|jgi:two-component system nitrogen regulation sensor histidine kinase GlnL|nr:PAS domain-containing protein [Gammaproteobacteria bacterium]
MQLSTHTPSAAVDTAERILDTLNSSIMCLDEKRQITYINSAGEALFESSAASLVGRQFASLLSALEPSSILDKLRLESIDFTEHEAVITLVNGKAITANYSIYRFDSHSHDGEILLEIRQLERQAQFAQDELKQQQQLATQQLARGLAHEINNPLGGIRGAAQLLQRALDRPEWTEYTEVIISEVDRLQSLTSNMLGPGSRMQRKPVNILEVLEHIRRIILAAEPGRIVIKRDYDPSIPELNADRDMLIQAFLNIVRNAVQAIDSEGCITFRTRVDFRYTIGQITHPLVLRVDISDTGHGIPRDLGETIFLPMITDKADGSGLGLPIAQEIISRHGGTIHLHSSPSGTTFSTYLPLEQS